MPIKDSFADRLAKQAEDRKRLLARVAAKRARFQEQATSHQATTRSGATYGSSTEDGVVVGQATSSVVAACSSKATSPVSQAWKQVRFGASELELFARQDAERVHAQPWTVCLTDRVLEAAETSSIHLVLVWPVKLDGLALLHARANSERVLHKDLRGLRTVLYPGSLATRNALQTVLLNRTRLSNLFRSLWQENDARAYVSKSATESKPMLALLNVINDVRSRNDARVPQPSFAEVTPTFLLGRDGQWTATGGTALERTVRKVQHKTWREILRGQVTPEWIDPKRAPGALLVVHNSLQRSQLKSALSSSTLRGDAAPEVFLLDATTRASEANYSAVRRIPEFLKMAREQSQPAGAVVVCDDPRTYVSMRVRLQELGLAVSAECFASEGDEPLFAKIPFGESWQPETRGNAYFEVSVVDQPASQVAVSFQRLAHAAGTEESPEHRLLQEACLFVLRLSNMPAGYVDLERLWTPGGPIEWAMQRNAWGPLRLRLDTLLAVGALSGRRTELQKAVERAESLLAAWNNATPMAERLLSKVERHLAAERNSVSVVVPSGRYVKLAQTFLQRRLGTRWAGLESRIEWHTLYSVAKTFSGDHRRHHIVFIGVNADVLRILLTHPAVPHGTTVFMAYKQADGVLKTLTALRTPNAYKSYRGRIGLLSQELERRLQEMPNPPDIARIADLPLTFNLDSEYDGPAGNPNQSTYRFDLYDGGTAYAAGTVYQYVPDEDPLFRRVQARSIVPGDEIFEMDDALRMRLEQALNISGGAAQGIVSPLRMLMRLYRQDVQTRCDLLFGVQKRSRLAQAVHAKMVELDARAEHCRAGRVYYWLDLGDVGDTRPHAPSDSNFFQLFCQALQISNADADRYWLLVRQTRSLNQNLGRELSARYAEILFQPESAVIYRGVLREAIAKLQQDAVRCVHRVVEVHPPAAHAAQQAQ
jgi:hypothetical protein